jgi:alkylation response protein AidB-like acyl-CoA dehydrogenase
MQTSPAITPRTLFEHDHDMFRDSYRRFVQKEIGPHTQRWREQGYVDRDAFLKSGEHGFLLMWADEKYGGAGIRDFRYEQVMIEENLRYGDIGFFNTLHSRLVGPYIGEIGNEEQKQRFLPRCIKGECILAIAMTEPGAGSDLAGMKSRAEDRGDHWVLSGSKTYISNGQIADLIIVAARTVPDKTHGLGLFLVESDMPGFKRGRTSSRATCRVSNAAGISRRSGSRRRTRPSCSSTT